MSKTIKQRVVVSSHDASHGTFRSYTTGFILSLILTLIAYALVRGHISHNTFSHAFVMSAIVALAIIQLLVQLIYFFHLGRESKPRWNLVVLIFAAMVIIIIVGGSIWIMNNLSYKMTPTQINKYINHQDGL